MQNFLLLMQFTAPSEVALRACRPLDLRVESVMEDERETSLLLAAGFIVLLRVMPLQPLP